MMLNPLQLGVEAAECGLVPDVLLRRAIRALCRARLRVEGGREQESIESADRRSRFVESLRRQPIALRPEIANEQHYELPADFFAAVLGPRRKYSCCFFESNQATLAEAEQAALNLTCQRAELEDGQDILELGCGWGSLSLWMARHYPRSQITAVSNSASQRRFIERERDEAGLTNLRVVTADVNFLEWEAESFDRVVSVEMFEHLRNYDQLLARISRWLRTEGKLFVHMFCHRRLAYEFAAEGATNWMGRHFFTGGIMPSADLLAKFDEHLYVTHQSAWNGRHYQRTAEAWLTNLDRLRPEVLPILEANYGEQEAWRWYRRWRIFFLAVAELFGFDEGRQWCVSHYLLERVRRQPVRPASLLRNNA